MIVKKRPLVSVGLPTYNGEKTLVQTLDSLLAQDYPFIEIIISDNASTDRTSDICRDYAGRDNRIRYHRNDRNVGLIGNTNQVFKLSKGEYFMWAGDHDKWDVNLISVLVSEFLSHPAAVVCYGQHEYYDEDGRRTDKYYGEKAISDMDTRGLKEWARIQRVFDVFWTAPVVYGLIRSAALRKTSLFRPTYACDFLCVAELALHGEFRFVPTVTAYFLFPIKRKLSPQENMIRLLGPDYASLKNGKMIVKFPLVFSTLVTLRVILSTPLFPAQKLRLTYTVLRAITLFAFILSKNRILGFVLALMPQSIRRQLKSLTLRFRSTKEASG